MMYGFNSTWLAKSLTWWAVWIFQLWFKLWLKVLGDQQTREFRRIWPMHLTTLYMDMAKWLQILPKTGRSAVTNVALESEEKKRSYYNTGYSYLVTHPSRKLFFSFIMVSRVFINRVCVSKSVNNSRCCPRFHKT